MPDGVARLTGFPAPSGALDLPLAVGDIVHLQGPNGCGKSSLLRALAGLPAALQPTAVQVLAVDPRTVPAPRLATTVHYAPSDPRDGLVGLTVAGEFRLRRRPLPEDLRDLTARDVARLSTGELRRVALAVAAAPAPLLLLDEPAAGLDAAGRMRLTALVQAAARNGAVVVADHTGWVATLATRRIELAPPALAAPASQLPVVVGPPVLTAPATSVRRDGMTLRLPAVRLGPGFNVVVGPNGSGKTTLLERLAGLRDAAGVLVQGRPPVPGRTVRLLQADAGQRLCADTVGQELAQAHDAWGVASQVPRDRHPLALSAGEAHRVALAKTLGVAAPVYLLDEPEAHLDAQGRALLLRALADLAGRGACLVVATHDVDLVTLAQSRTEVKP